MQIEIRADKKSMAVRGYVNVVGRDSWYPRQKPGRMWSRSCLGAFAKALAANSNVELRFNHRKVLDNEDMEPGRTTLA